LERCSGGAENSVRENKDQIADHEVAGQGNIGHSVAGHKSLILEFKCEKSQLWNIRKKNGDK